MIWKWTICGPVISLPCVAGPGFCSLLSVLQIADQCSHTGDPLTSPTKRFGYPFTCLGNKTPSTPRRLLFFSCQRASIPFPSLLFYIFSSHIWSGGPKCYNSSKTVWQGGEKEAKREIRHLPLKWRARWGVKIFPSRILCSFRNHGYMERSELRGRCFDCREEHTLFHI